VINLRRKSRLEILCFTALGAGLAVLISAAAQSAAQGETLYAVYFRSDRCPNCIILDPALEHARSITGALPILHLTLDLDVSASEYDQAMYALIDRGMADLYNSYLGLTGVVFLVDPDTGLPFDCLTRRQNRDDLAARLERASTRMGQSGSAARSDAIGGVCPAPMRRLPDGRILGDQR
jgi:hypothetical protein